MTQRVRQFLAFFFCTLLLAPSLRAASQEQPFEQWESVLSAANGTALRVGISLEAYSALDYISTYYQERLRSGFEMSFALIPIPYDTLPDAQAAGLDAVWVTRRDLYRLYQNNQLTSGWTSLLPNLPFVRSAAMTITGDLGNDVLESAVPAFDVRFQLMINPEAFADPAAIPTTLDDLTRWIEQNPGRFTYITPESLYGDVFLQQLLILLSGGAQQWQGAYDDALYQRWSMELWDLLNDWEPNLWDRGVSYPRTINQANALLTNGETVFSFALSQGGALVAVNDGDVPPATTAILLGRQAVGDAVYFVIPSGTTNLAGAMVMANFLLEPRNQAHQLLPSNGFGFGQVLNLPSIDRVSDLNAFTAAFNTLTRATPSLAALNAASVPGLAPEYAIRLSRDWYTFVSGG